MAKLATFFLGNLGEETVFYDILEQKIRLSRLEKQDLKKVEKFTFFQRGGFGPKMAILALFFFGQYRVGRCLLRYSRTKIRLSRL